MVVKYLMDTKEQSLLRLKEILDRLGPGAWLQIDDRWISHLFSGSLEAAKEFARENHCAFRYNKESRFGEFGRAYSKKWLTPH
jgi:hypothetical protein